MAKPRFTPDQVADALKETRGMVYLAAKRLGCSHVTVQNYANRYAMVREALQTQRGQLIDTAELKLWHAVTEGESWAVLFALRTIGKDRGYVERQEVTGKDGEPVGIQVQAIDYRSAVAPLAPLALGPVGHSPAPGQDEGALDGPEVG